MVTMIVHSNSIEEDVDLHLLVDNSSRLKLYEKILQEHPLNFDVNLYFGR